MRFGKKLGPLIERPFFKSRYTALPILKILVPQLGHVPTVAGLPFFIVIG
jgi:hypothetical protein